MKIPVRINGERNNSALRLLFRRREKGEQVWKFEFVSNSTALSLIEHRSTGRIFFDRLFDRVRPLNFENLNRGAKRRERGIFRRGRILEPSVGSLLMRNLEFDRVSNPKSMEGIEND